MKKVILKWTYYADIINVPNDIIVDIYDYQMKFDKWLSDKDSKHNYWVTLQNEEGNSLALSFDSEAFVTWLNDNVLSDSIEKVTFEEKDIQLSDEHKSLPLLYFDIILVIKCWYLFKIISRKNKVLSNQTQFFFYCCPMGTTGDILSPYKVVLRNHSKNIYK